LLAALAEPTDLARGGEPEVARLICGRVPDLFSHGLGHHLRHPAGSSPGRNRAISLLRIAAVHGLSGSAHGLADSTGELAGPFAYLSERLAGTADEALEVAGGLSGPLAETSDGLTGALTHVTDSLTGALADIANGLPRALADIAHSLAGALADVLQRALGALPDFLGGIPRPVDGITGTLADLRYGTAQSVHQLGVAVQTRHQAVYDRGNVIEPRLE
jgi:hypothetical protein